MKNIFLLSIVFSIKLLASNVWFTDVNKSIEIAKNYHVPILVFIYKSGCVYCEKSINGFNYPPLRDTLTNKTILPLAINASNLIALRRLNLTTNMYPSYFILSENGLRITSPVKGYVEARDLNDYIHRVASKYGKISN